MKRILWLSFMLGLILGTGQAQNLIPYRHGDLWGFADPNGKIVIPPVWDEVKRFESGHALVRQCDKWGSSIRKAN
jgi:hypothetical protein